MTYIALRLVRNRVSNVGQIEQECKTIYVPVPSYEAEQSLELGSGEWRIDQAEIVNCNYDQTGWNCSQTSVNLATASREHDERRNCI